MGAALLILALVLIGLWLWLGRNKDRKDKKVERVIRHYPSTGQDLVEFEDGSEAIRNPDGSFQPDKKVRHQ